MKNFVRTALSFACVAVASVVLVGCSMRDDIDELKKEQAAQDKVDEDLQGQIDALKGRVVTLEEFKTQLSGKYYIDGQPTYTAGTPGYWTFKVTKYDGSDSKTLTVTDGKDGKSPIFTVNGNTLSWTYGDDAKAGSVTLPTSVADVEVKTDDAGHVTLVVSYTDGTASKELDMTQFLDDVLARLKAAEEDIDAAQGDISKLREDYDKLNGTVEQYKKDLEKAIKDAETAANKYTDEQVTIVSDNLTKLNNAINGYIKLLNDVLDGIYGATEGLDNTTIAATESYVKTLIDNLNALNTQINGEGGLAEQLRKAQQDIQKNTGNIAENLQKINAITEGLYGDGTFNEPAEGSVLDLINKNISRIDGRVDVLTGRMDTAENDIDKLEATLGAATDEAKKDGSVFARLNWIYSELVRIEGKVDANKASIDAIQALLYGNGTAAKPAEGSIMADIDAIQATIGSRNDAATLDTIWGNINKITAQLSVVYDWITSYGNCYFTKLNDKGELVKAYDVPVAYTVPSNIQIEAVNGMFNNKEMNFEVKKASYMLLSVEPSLAEIAASQVDLIYSYKTHSRLTAATRTVVDEEANAETQIPGVYVISLKRLSEYAKPLDIVKQAYYGYNYDKTATVKDEADLWYESYGKTFGGSGAQDAWVVEYGFTAEARTAIEEIANKFGMENVQLYWKVAVNFKDLATFGFPNATLRSDNTVAINDNAPAVKDWEGALGVYGYRNVKGNSKDCVDHSEDVAANYKKLAPVADAICINMLYGDTFEGEVTFNENTDDVDDTFVGYVAERPEAIVTEMTSVKYWTFDAANGTYPETPVEGLTETPTWYEAACFVNKFGASATDPVAARMAAVVNKDKVNYLPVNDLSIAPNMTNFAPKGTVAVYTFKSYVEENANISPLTYAIKVWSFDQDIDLNLDGFAQMIIPTSNTNVLGKQNNETFVITKYTQSELIKMLYEAGYSDEMVRTISLADNKPMLKKYNVNTANGLKADAKNLSEYGFTADEYVASDYSADPIVGMWDTTYPAGTVTFTKNMTINGVAADRDVLYVGADGTDDSRKLFADATQYITPGYYNLSIAVNINTGIEDLPSNVEGLANGVIQVTFSYDFQIYEAQYVIKMKDGVQVVKGSDALVKDIDGVNDGDMCVIVDMYENPYYELLTNYILNNATAVVTTDPIKGKTVATPGYYYFGYQNTPAGPVAIESVRWENGQVVYPRDNENWIPAYVSNEGVYAYPTYMYNGNTNENPTTVNGGVEQLYDWSLNEYASKYTTVVDLALAKLTTPNKPVVINYTFSVKYISGQEVPVYVVFENEIDKCVNGTKSNYMLKDNCINNIKFIMNPVQIKDVKAASFFESMTTPKDRWNYVDGKIETTSAMRNGYPNYAHYPSSDNAAYNWYNYQYVGVSSTGVAEKDYGKKWSLEQYLEYVNYKGLLRVDGKYDSYRAAVTDAKSLIAVAATTGATMKDIQFETANLEKGDNTFMTETNLATVNFVDMTSFANKTVGVTNMQTAYFTFVPEQYSSWAFAEFNADNAVVGASVLKNYILQKGYVVVKDIWGNEAWDNFRFQVIRYEDNDGFSASLDPITATEVE